METGRTDGMDADGDSPNSLHSFTGPPVPQGEGTSIARAFLDGNHTLISIMARINPSPDWFVGVDSFQLCVEGNWVDTVTVEVIIVDERSLISIHTPSARPARTSAPEIYVCSIGFLRSNGRPTNFNREARFNNELGRAPCIWKIRSTSRWKISHSSHSSERAGPVRQKLA